MMEEKQVYMTRGGNGSHLQGFEETHWDCKIAMLEKEIVELRDKIDSMGIMIEILMSDKEGEDEYYEL